MAKVGECFSDMLDHERMTRSTFDWVAKLRPDFPLIEQKTAEGLVRALLHRIHLAEPRTVWMHSQLDDLWNYCASGSDWLALLPRGVAGSFFDFVRSASRGFGAPTLSALPSY